MKFSSPHLVALWAAALLGLHLSAAPSSADTAPAEWVALYESHPTRGQTPFDSVAALTTDGEGNVYSAITGEYDEGDDHIVVVKYDAAGVVQWTNSFLGGSRTTADEITLDNAGNVYVAGVDRNSLATPGNPATGADIVTLKFDLDGALLWSAHYAQSSSDAPEDIAVNPADQVYVTGYSYNETDRDTLFGPVGLLGSGVLPWSPRNAQRGDARAQGDGPSPFPTYLRAPRQRSFSLRTSSS
ncbi:MAG: hypothetical protein ACKJSK_02335 [Roseibacillus sp.]